VPETTPLGAFSWGDYGGEGNTQPKKAQRTWAGNRVGEEKKSIFGREGAPFGGHRIRLMGGKNQGRAPDWRE